MEESFRMEQLLLVDGKLILIKLVAQAVPTFSMFFFNLRRGLCDHINSLLHNFWLGQQGG